MNRAARRGAAGALLGFAFAAAIYFDLARALDRAFSDLGRP